LNFLAVSAILFVYNKGLSRRKDPLKEFSEIDSKFRYVIVAALRAKELLNGAKPKLESSSKNLIRVAQEEVNSSLIEYRLVEPGQDLDRGKEDDLFIGEKLVQEIVEEKKETVLDRLMADNKPKKSKRRS